MYPTSRDIGQMADDRITYRAKKSILCPICGSKFRREELLTGGGRMNAGELTDELHRIYLPTRKHGYVYPLIYPVSVCPDCCYAAYPRHFDTLEGEEYPQIESRIEEWKKIVQPLFQDLDFSKNRRLEEGVASYLLAALCYEYRSPITAPTFMRGLSFLRAGWLAVDLDREKKGGNYDAMSRIFLRKAAFFYNGALERGLSGKEDIEDINHHGPDLDNNFGFDGVLYLVGVLQLKYGQRANRGSRISALKRARTAVSRIVGMGLSTKAKPSSLLDLSRKLHKSIKFELEAGEA